MSISFFQFLMNIHLPPRLCLKHCIQYYMPFFGLNQVYFPTVSKLFSFILHKTIVGSIQSEMADKVMPGDPVQRTGRIQTCQFLELL